MNQYAYQVKLLTPEDGGGWMAYFPTLGEYTVYGLGDTISEAIVAALEALDGVMAFWAEKGLPVPPPTEWDLEQTRALTATNTSYAYAA